MRLRPWRELFEQLPPEDQAAIKANTAKVVGELEPAKAAKAEAPGPRRPGAASGSVQEHAGRQPRSG